jgi:hypothetical protein
MRNSNYMEESENWEANSRKSVKKLSAFYGTTRFISVSTRARHWTLF